MTALICQPYIAAPPARQQALTQPAWPGFNWPMQPPPPPPKAQAAAIARAARRAAEEAAALRENLRRRKAQARTRETPPQDSEKCR